MILHLRQSHLLALGAICAGCASAAATPRSNSNQVPVTVEIAGSGDARNTQFRYYRDVNTNTVTVAAPRSKVLAALLTTYQVLEVPVTAYEPARGIVGAGNVGLMGHIGKRRLSSIVSCGMTAMGSPRADSYRVYLNAISQVVQTGDSSHTAVQTTVTAKASDPSQSSTTVDCSSTGGLEEQIANSLEKTFGGS